MFLLLFDQTLNFDLLAFIVSTRNAVYVLLNQTFTFASRNKIIFLSLKTFANGYSLVVTALQLNDVSSTVHIKTFKKESNCKQLQVISSVQYL